MADTSGPENDRDKSHDEWDDDLQALVDELRAIVPTNDGRASPEEIVLFCRLLGLDAPSHDSQIPLPTKEEMGRLREWIKDATAVSERERIEFFRRCHHSATWRSIVGELSGGSVPRAAMSANHLNEP